MRCLRSLLFPLFLLVALGLPARAQGTRIKDLPLTTSIPADGRIALDASTFTALRGISVQQLATNLGTLAVANKLDTTNGVAVGLSTPTAPTSSNNVVNKAALDAAITTSADGKLDKTNGVATSLSTVTVAAASNDVVSLRAAWKLNGDVRYWGAVGDGTTDDTVAITAAVSAATNIYLPDGVFLVNGTSIPIIDNLQVRARGPGSATIKRTVGGSAAFTAAANQKATNVVFSGVRFLGAYWDTGDITRSAITFQTNGTLGAVVRDCSFEGFVAGVRSLRGNTNLTVMLNTGRALADALVLAYAPVGGRFIGNTLDGSRTGIGDGLRTRVGIWLHDPGDGAGPGWGNLVNVNRITGTRNEGIICNQAITVVDANIVSDATDGASGTYGIVVETTGATGTGLIGLGAGCLVKASNNQVYNCDGGIRVSVDPVNLTQSTPQDVLVDGNMVKGCTGANTKGICIGFSGVGTNYYGYRINAANNWVYNQSATGNADGIYLLNVQQGSVTANHIFNAKRYGVILDTLAAGTTNQVAGVAITGNDIHDSGSAQVYLFPRVAGAIVRASVNANSFFWSGTQTGNGVEVDNGVTNGIVECSFLGNAFQGNASYNGYGLLLNGSNLVAASNVGNLIYGRVVHTNGTTTWLSNGNVNDVNGRKIFFDSAAPASTSQQHNAGDICWNTSLTAGGPVGWICITAGTAGSSAGVWKDFGIAGVQAALDLKYDKTGGAISGSATVGGTFGVTGATTLAGNTTVGGTLGVTGVVTASNDISVPNGKNYRSFTTNGTAINVLGVDGNNYTQVGSSSSPRLYLNVGADGAHLGLVTTGGDIYIPRIGVASAGTTTRNSRGLDFITSHWSGSAEVQHDNYIRALQVDATGKTAIQVVANGTTLANFYSDGIANFPVSISSPAIDAGGAGFTGSGAGITALNMANAGSGTLTANGRGGTGQSSYTTGDTLYAASSTFLNKLAIGANGTVYTVAAGVPSWATPSVAVGGITGLGTGVATALAVNTGSAGAFVVNGGALGTPSSGTLTSATGLPISTGVSGLGTGVATALAVNVGSAGAPVVNGGALGTPSSGTLTSATGLPISTGVSGLGTGVATALATPTSANLATALTDETGTGGGFVRADGATVTNMSFGVAGSAQKVAVFGSGSVLSYGNASNSDLNAIVGLNALTGYLSASSGSAVTASATIPATDLTGTINSARLPTSGVTAGSYGNGSYSATITVDTYGRVTAVTTNAISGGGGSTTTSFVVLDGSVGVTTISSGNGFTNGGVIINMTTHGLTTGDVVWFQNSTKGPVIDTAYYVTVVDADNYKISTSQANRLASTFVSATASGACFMRRWNSNPILASSNVDGVIRPWSKTAGTYIVDFTTNPSDAYYAVSGSAKTVTDGTPLLFTGESRAATTSAFAVQVTDTSGGLTDSDRVSITATR